MMSQYQKPGSDQRPERPHSEEPLTPNCLSWFPHTCNWSMMLRVRTIPRVHAKTRPSPCPLMLWMRPWKTTETKPKRQEQEKLKQNADIINHHQWKRNVWVWYHRNPLIWPTQPTQPSRPPRSINYSSANPTQTSFHQLLPYQKRYRQDMVSDMRQWWWWTRE